MFFCNSHSRGVKSVKWQVMVFLFFVLATPTAVLAQGDSGFLRGAGKLDIALTAFSDRYDSFWFGPDRRTDPPFGEVTRDSLNLYVSYGLNDTMDLTVLAAYVESETEAVFEGEKDFQDSVVQFKWLVHSWAVNSGKVNVLLTPSIKVPLSDYENDAVPAIGDGQVDFRFRGVIQYHLNNGAYIALETGYDVRRDLPENEVPIHLMGGFSIGKNLILSGFYSNLNSLDGYDISEGPFYGVQEDIEKVGINAHYWVLEGFGVTAGYGDTLSGRNTGDVKSYSLGTVFRF